MSHFVIKKLSQFLDVITVKRIMGFSIVTFPYDKKTAKQSVFSQNRFSVIIIIIIIFIS